MVLRKVLCLKPATAFSSAVERGRHAPKSLRMRLPGRSRHRVYAGMCRTSTCADAVVHPAACRGVYLALPLSTSRAANSTVALATKTLFRARARCNEAWLRMLAKATFLNQCRSLFVILVSESSQAASRS